MRGRALKGSVGSTAHPAGAAHGPLTTARPDEGELRVAQGTDLLREAVAGLRIGHIAEPASAVVDGASSGLLFQLSGSPFASRPCGAQRAACATFRPPDRIPPSR